MATSKPKDRRVTKECPHCGTSFITKFVAKKYCTSKCAKAHWGKLNPVKAGPKVRTIAKCPVCDKHFEKTSANKVYCDRKCYISDHSRTNSYKESTRKSHLKKTYGITLVDYENLLQAQRGSCKICGMSPQDNGKLLAVDHNHVTGKVRGLLCTKCNTALGSMKDSPKLLRNAAKYLEDHDGKEIL